MVVVDQSFVCSSFVFGASFLSLRERASFVVRAADDEDEKESDARALEKPLSEGTEKAK